MAKINPKRIFFYVLGILIIASLFLVVLTNKHSSEILETCGIENCHGMEIECGPNIAEICTEIYMAGDNCRQYAECAVIDGKCRLKESQIFEGCKSCVEECYTEFEENQMGFFDCESKCSEQNQE